MDLAPLWKAALLGVVEGATEFIPVSSTGHLIVVQDWIDFTGPKENAFAVVIQLGAIFAVVWLYRAKFLHIAANLRRDAEARRLVANMAIGTLPAVVVGLPTEKWIEAHFFRPFPVGAALVAGGIAILVVERRYRKPHVKTVDGVSIKQALGVGVCQVLAIVFPGFSRSAATILGGMALGLSRTAATEFSFFLAVPAMIGAALVKLVGVRDVIAPGDAPWFLIGFAVSFISALVAIRALLAFVSQNSFAPFAWYRIVFGAAILWMYGAPAET